MTASPWSRKVIPYNTFLKLFQTGHLCIFSGADIPSWDHIRECLPDIDNFFAAQIESYRPIYDTKHSDHSNYYKYFKLVKLAVERKYFYMPHKLEQSKLNKESVIKHHYTAKRDYFFNRCRAITKNKSGSGLAEAEERRKQIESKDEYQRYKFLTNFKKDSSETESVSSFVTGQDPLEGGCETSVRQALFFGHFGDVLVATSEHPVENGRWFSQKWFHSFG